MKTKVLLGSLLVALTGATYVSYQLLKDNDVAYVPRNESGTKNIAGFEDEKGIMVDNDIFRQFRAMPNGEVDNSEILKAKQQVQRRISSRSALGLDWQFMGPANIGGRTRSILVDKDNSNRIYAAAISGGLWISNNAGSTWEPYDDLMDNLIASCIVQAPNGDLYLGTGNSLEGNGGTATMPGGGIYKSTDGGETFNKLESTNPETQGNQWEKINSIVVNPNNSDEVYAGTGSGLYLSTDGGATWTHNMALNLTNCTLERTGVVQDLEITSDGKLFVGLGGDLYASDTPTDRCSFEAVSNGFSGSSRVDITICENDENYVYALLVNGGGQLEAVYKSLDKGVSWANLDPAAPSTTIDSVFNLFGDNGQGMYDMAIQVFPNDCEKLMIGGVQNYRVANSWARISENFAGKNSGFYIHSDIHYYEFDPNNPNILYVGSDGGVGKSTNANAVQPTWTDNNRNYGTTQLYGMAFSSDGRIIGGTQDNGTFYIDPSLPGESGRDASEILGGDGFDCEVSTIGEFAITSLYYGQVYRIDATTGSSSFLTSGYTDGTGQSAPFWTVLRLWESKNDVTSKDSITFVNDSTELSIGRGNGSTRSYSGTIAPVQDAAEVILGSVYFRNSFASTVQIVEDPDGDGVLTYETDSVGTIDYATGEYIFSFPIAPFNQSNVSVFFKTTFDAGDVLVLASDNQDYPFEYVLTTNLGVGDSVVVQDPVQTLLAVSLANSTIITRESIKDDRQPQWFNLSQVASSGTPVAFEFSNDGNHLYVASGGRVGRYSGLNDLYSEQDLSNVTYTTLYNSSSTVTGLAMHPTDPEKLLVTVAGYGHSEHIYEFSNAQSANGLAINIDKQGDLPQIPVYDAEYNVADPNIVLIGTDFGVWSTEDINASNVEWSTENATLANTPIFDVRQQKLNYDEALNFHRFYLGTHGRGIWSTGDLVSAPTIDRNEASSKDLGLKVYPNPISDGTASVDFTLNTSGSIHVRVFDLSGKMVREYNSRHYQAGNNKFTFDTGDLTGGSYIMTVEAGSTYSTAKFVVVK